LGATYSSLRLETKSTQLRPHGLDSATASAFALRFASGHGWQRDARGSPNPRTDVDGRLSQN
jgi:hypothetical protein